MNWLNEKEALENAIKNGESYESLGRKYEVSGAYIKKIAQKLGITLPKRRKINNKETFNKGKAKTKICQYCGKPYLNWNKNSLFCSLDCNNNYKKDQKYQEYLQKQEKYNGNLHMKWIKPHIMREQNNKCAICGMSNIWNNKPLIFVLDHIDGKAKNNTRNNLRLICHNCDSQLETYKSKNKKSDREYYHFHHR